MSVRLTMEDFQEATQKAKTKEITTEEKERREEFGRKMRAHLSEERRQRSIKVEEENKSSK